MNLETILTAVLSPTTGVDERRFAHEQLELFKQREDALESCLNLFLQFSQTQPRNETMRHFALRSCSDLVRAKYSKMTPTTMKQLKTAVVTILSKYLDNPTSKIVENSAVILAVEILRQDSDVANFFHAIAEGLKENWAKMAALVIIEFSETVINEDEETMLQARRSQLSKFLVSASPALFHLNLNLIDSAIVVKNEILLIIFLNLANELLSHWTTPSKENYQRALFLFESCASPQLPVSIVNAAYGALKGFCSSKTSDLEKNDISIPALYEVIRKCVVLRTPFRNDEELYEGADVLITTISKHETKLPKVTMRQDLQKLTESANPLVVSDAVTLWKDLLVKGLVEVDQVLVNSLVKVCAFSARSIGEEGDEEEDHRGHLIKELAKRQPDWVCSSVKSYLELALSNNKWHEAWFLAEAISGGLSPKHLDQFSNKASLSSSTSSFIPHLEAILEAIYLVCSSPPITAEKLKLLHAPHRLFESRTDYLARALQYFVNLSLDTTLPSELKKRAAASLLLIFRRISNLKKDEFLSGTILPSLVQRVSSAFPTLNGPERFVLLECILVAGKSLPKPEDRVLLTQEVLNQPFQVLLQSGSQVMSDFLQLSTTASKPSKPWDARGYFADVEALPPLSKEVSIALMTLSTCSQDGALTTQMWEQLIPFAIECLGRLDMLWETAIPEIQWALTIHPVDARSILGGRLAESMESFIEGLDEYGESYLKIERMAVISFLSSARSCSEELLKGASTLKLVNKSSLARIYRAYQIIENRHLASLLSCVSLTQNEMDLELFDQVASHISIRLQNSIANPSWRVRTYPNCRSELVEDMEDAARCSLELAFARALASCPIITESRFIWLAERVVLGDDLASRVACQGITEKYMAKFNPSALARIALKACVAAIAKPNVSENVRRNVIELATETCSRIFWSASIKDYQKTKKKKLNNVSTLFDLFGQSLSNKLIEEVQSAVSEKTIKSAVSDFLVIAAAATTPNNGISGEVKASEKKKKKKNKNKRGNGDENSGDMMIEVSNTTVPAWHNATNAKDLGMVLLFGGQHDGYDDL